MSEKATRTRRFGQSRGSSTWLDPKRFSAQCRGKDRYPSKKEAAGKARSIRQRNGEMNSLHAYRCPACRYWHIGSGGPPRAEGA